MSNTTFTVFQEPWWLDGVAPNAWDAVEIQEGGRTVARFPFVIREANGSLNLGQPKLTQSLGPWIETAPDASTNTQLSRQKDLFTKLIKRLPPHQSFLQNFAPQVTDWLPFYWQGFTQTTRYTYALDLSQSDEELLAGASKNTRKRIRSASRSVSVGVENDLDILLRLNDMTFARQEMEPPYTHDYVRRLDDAVTRNGVRILTVARDLDTGRPTAAAYGVGDGRRIYLLMSGADPEKRSSGAGYLTKWHLIQESKKTSEVFDFEGSMIERIESFNRGFGAQQVPYFQVRKSAPRGPVPLKTQLKQTAYALAKAALRR